MRIIPILILSLLAGCSYVPTAFSPHRIEIQQGNFLTQEMVAQLKAGMTKDQVRYLLGTPLVIDVFRDDRWDYAFFRQRANSREVEQRRITIHFADGMLSRVDGDVVATPSQNREASSTPANATLENASRGDTAAGPK